MTPIERAARAIWEISGKPYHPQDIIAGMQAPDALPDWERFVPQARAVLAAVREPSEVMEDAAMDRGKLGYDPPPSSVWTAMIDAMLEEG